MIERPAPAPALTLPAPNSAQMRFQHGEIEMKFEQAKRSVASIQQEQARELQDQQRTAAKSEECAPPASLSAPSPLADDQRACRAGRYKQKLEQATAKNKELVGEVAQMGQKMDHAQKETKAMKAQLKMQATRTDAQKSEIDEQTKRQGDTAQLIERVRHRLARLLAPHPLARR